MKFYDNRSTDPAFNLALEEVLGANHSDEIFMLWRNRPAIIVGRNQNTAAEINAEYVNRNAIEVVRRMTGGGAVYHDLGNINYTMVVNGRNPNPDSFAEFIAPVVEALRKLGVPAEFSGRNDILAAGGKISGSAQSCYRSRTLFHGTLLFSVDLDILGKSLNPSRLKMASKGIKSVRSRVVNVTEFLPEFSVEEFMARFAEAMVPALGTSAPEALPAAVAAEAERLACEKYRTWEWNFGIRGEYNFTHAGRFPCGEVKLELKVSENRIEAASLTGDFFGRRPSGELSSKLVGVLFRKDEIEKAFAEIDMTEYIHNMKREDFFSLFE